MSKGNISSIQKLKLWFYTLFYHSSFSFEYVVDTIMEPIFWFVDQVSQPILGPAFVVVVVILVSYVVVVAHLIGQKMSIFFN